MRLDGQRIMDGVLLESRGTLGKAYGVHGGAEFVLFSQRRNIMFIPAK